MVGRRSCMLTSPECNREGLKSRGATEPPPTAESPATLSHLHNAVGRPEIHPKIVEIDQ
jgi:hypothetical protein